MEATKFRPREVVRHVLQTAAASLQKILTLEGHVADDVPVEVRTLLHILQRFTNDMVCEMACMLYCSHFPSISM